MENQSFNRVYGFEVSVKKGKVFFPDVETLRNKVITHIEVVPVSATPSGANPAYQTIVLNAYITLTDMSAKEIYSRDNIDNYDATLTAGRKQLINSKINLPSSYIEIVDDIDGSFYFVAYYNENAQKYNDTKAIELYYQELIADGSRRIYFPENQKLVGKKLTNIFVAPETSMTKSASGTPQVSTDWMKGAYLTLVMGSKEVLRRVPLICFAQQKNYFTLKMNNIPFDLVSSFVECYAVVNRPENVNKAFYLTFETEAK